MRTPYRRGLDLTVRTPFVCGLCLLAQLLLALPATARGRPPAVAGQFYPADPVKLRGAVEAFLQDAVAPLGERPIALIAPHAGYIFSGQIAADAYGQAVGHDYDLIVILGTNHTTPGFDQVSVYDGEGYRTPLGLAGIDGEIVSQLRVASGDITFTPALHAREHSVEVQVPFVQVAFPHTPIVTAILGTPDPALCRRFGETLARVLAERRALIVASSDLSHYPVYDDAVDSDLAILAGIASLDPATLHKTIEQHMRAGAPALATCACGEAPILAAMTAAGKLGAKSSQVVSYANSGDTLVGDRKRVVGYGAVILVEADRPAGGSPTWRSPPNGGAGPVTDEDRVGLVRFARRTIRQYLETETTPLPRLPSGPAWQPQGAFVTLEKRGELRGCMGSRRTDLPLVRVVGSMALEAALNDRRFTPVDRDELDALEIRISLLGPSRRVPSARVVRMGQDGVLLSKNGRQALFLPEVAAQFDFDPEVFFERLCLKAGLNGDCWQQGAELHTFQTDSFSESDLGLTGP